MSLRQIPFLRRHTLTVLFLLAMCAMARASLATTIVVDPSGSGDATTFQAGYDLIRTLPSLPETTRHTPPETLIVRPGYYDESVFLRGQLYRGTGIHIVCPGGPGSARLRRFEPIEAPSLYRVQVHGLEVEERVQAQGGGRFSGIHWHSCRFLSGVRSDMRPSGGAPPNFHGCEFHGRVELLEYTPGDSLWFTNLKFVDAGLFLSTMVGSVGFRNCSFEGADTLANVRATIDNELIFQDCTFARGRYGLFWRSQSAGAPLRLIRCRFQDFAESAVHFDSPEPTDRYLARGLDVEGSRFERCGQAVHWVSSNAFVVLRNTQITETRGTAIDVLACQASFENIEITRAGGDGIQLSYRHDLREGGDVRIANCRVRSAAGSGIVARDLGGGREGLPFGLFGNVVAGNGRAGMDVHGSAILEANQSYRNRGDGIRIGPAAPMAERYRWLEARAPAESPSPAAVTTVNVRHNTMVLNGDAGLVFQGGADVFVENNLAAGNRGNGIGVTTTGTAQVVCNDSWRNGGAEYAGVAAAAGNLIADPRFCDVAADDYHVQTDSPCVPSGTCGQIGALGVGCDAVTVEAVARLRDHGRHKRWKQPIQVAILGGPLFDVSSIDRKSVRLGGAEPKGHGRGHRRAPDVNRDGWPDLLLAFRTRDIDFVGDSALLVGRTRDSVPIEAWVSFERRGRRHCDWDDAELAGDPEALATDGDATEEIGTEAPRTLRIERLSPNPSSGAGVLEFALPAGGPAAIDVFDLVGRRVWSRSLAGWTPGVHRIAIDRRRFAIGVYVVVLSQGKERHKVRWVVAR